MDVDSPRPVQADLPSREDEDVVVSAPAAAVPQQAESSVQAQMQSESVTPTPAQPESTTQEQQSQIQSQTQTQSQTQSHPTTPPPRSSFTTPQPRSDAIEIDLDSPLPKPLTTTATTSNDASTSAAAEPVTANGTAANIDTPMPLANGHDEAEPREDTSSASSSHPASNGAQNEEDDMDRFLKRMEMEKKIAHLQQRLELASFKTNNGWSDMSINEIEHRLPSPQQPRRPQVVSTGGRGGTAYEPPSPSRPWQLADVLWQPLPQPGGHPGGPPPLPAQVNHRRPPHGMHAPSHSLPGGLPSFASLQHRGSLPAQPSPRRPRPGMDEYLNRPTLSPLRGPAGQGVPPGRHANGHVVNGQPRNGQSSGHRRASSSISSLPFLGADPYPSSPLRPKKGAKKRSQSHSNARERPTTQDVDAARALTFMLESARSPTSPTATNGRLPDLPHPGQPGPRLPPLQHANNISPPRQRAQSFAAEPRDPSEHARVAPMGPPGLRTPSSHTRGRGTSIDSSASFREGFWQVHPPSNGKPRPPPPSTDREREQREHDRQRERERDRSDRDDENMADRPDDDKKAVELMMFLASSPSPARKRPSTDISTSFGSTARVLFSEETREATREREREPAPGPRPAPPSGLPTPRRLEPVARS